MLLQHDASVKLATTERKLTALHSIAEQENVDIINSILQFNAGKDRQRKSALLFIAGCGKTNVTESLFSFGAGKEARNIYDYTPMHHAAHTGHAKAINVLYQHNAHTEARCRKSITPIYHTAPMGSSSAVKSSDRGNDD